MIINLDELGHKFHVQYHNMSVTLACDVCDHVINISKFEYENNYIDIHTIDKNVFDFYSKTCNEAVLENVI